MLEIIKKLRNLILNMVTDESDYCDLSDTINELEEKYEDLKENSIISLDKFKRELGAQNLMSDELREFIDRYMQFDNHE